MRPGSIPERSEGTALPPCDVPRGCVLPCHLNTPSHRRGTPRHKGARGGVHCGPPRHHKTDVFQGGCSEQAVFFWLLFSGIGDG